MIKKAYKAVMSRGDDLKLDPDEVETVMAGAAQGVLIRTRQGLINPSYLVTIIEDKERLAKFLEDTKYPQDADRRARGMEPLSDIFKELPKLGGQNLKQLNPFPKDKSVIN